MNRALMLLVIASTLVACRVERGGLEPGEGTVFVDIHDNGFSPDTIRVEVGKSVRWTNRSATPHAIEAVTFSSQTLYQGFWFQARFETPGAYDYFCPLHTKDGTVIAE